MKTGDQRSAFRIERIRRTGFLLLLWLPLLTIVISRDPRFPVPRSSLEWFGFPGEFRHYFSHYFPLRDHLAGLHSRILLKIDGPSEAGPVTVGNDGWLFLRLSRDRIDASVGHGELTALREERERRAGWCRERGIRYCVLVVPSKDSIYADQLPKRYVKLVPPAHSVSQAARFLMTKAEDIDVVDVRQRFLDSKRLGPLYFKTDSHWTELGGYLAAEELIRKLFTTPDGGISEPFTLRMEQSEGGNEAQVLGLRQQTIEWVPRVIFENARGPRLRDGSLVRVNTINLSGFDSSLLETVHPDAPHASAMVFHNSFGVALVPFLSRHFRVCSFIWNPFSEALIEKSRPEVVIDLLTTF
jgi:hypothetical protein